jgi:hypothetical protein
MAVKAACPGVSRNVIVDDDAELAEGSMEDRETEKAPMCWVIPPASPEATEV